MHGKIPRKFCSGHQLRECLTLVVLGCLVPLEVLEASPRMLWGPCRARCQTESVAFKAAASLPSSFEPRLPEGEIRFRSCCFSFSILGLPMPCLCRILNDFFLAVVGPPHCLQYSQCPGPLSYHSPEASPLKLNPVASDDAHREPQENSWSLSSSPPNIDHHLASNHGGPFSHTK